MHRPDREEYSSKNTAQDLKGRRDVQLLAAFLFVVASGAAIVAYAGDRAVFLYFGDAASHIVKTRQFVDSQLPGIRNIATVWLPLPHLILLPFVLIDGLFYTGIAAPVVGIPCLVGTGLLLFLIIRSLTGSRPVAFFLSCLFSLNPNLVYMAMTPMNEPTLIFLVTLGGYTLLRWVQTQEVRWLFWTSVAVALASLCRYEAWLLVPYVSLLAVIKALSRWRRGDGAAALRLCLVAGICWLGLVFWFFWNWIEFGDAMKFAHWTYNIMPEAVRERQKLQTVSSVLGTALLTIFGPAMILCSLGGALWLGRLLPRTKTHEVVAFFFLPTLFVIVSILKGFVGVDQWLWNWRYVLTIGLFLSTTSAVVLAKFLARVRSIALRGMVFACFLAMPVIQFTVPSVGVSTYKDARRMYYGGISLDTDLGARLPGLCRDGSIALIMGQGQGQRIMLSSWLPLRDFHLLPYPGGEDIHGPISAGDRYVLIGKDRMPVSREVVDYWLSRRSEILRLYNVLLEDDHYLLLERKP